MSRPRSDIGTDLTMLMMLFCLWSSSGRSWWQFAAFVALGWWVNYLQETRP